MLVQEEYTHISDTDIVHKVLREDVAFFELLIRRNNPHLYKVGRSYGFEHHDVEDLMQETYVSAYTNLAKFEGKSMFKTWLIRIMINHCNKKLQKASYKYETTHETQIKEDKIPIYSNNRNTEAMLLSKELGGVMEAAIEKIPVEYRIVFSLRELNGLSVSETASALNISEANVKVRLNRAKNMLKKHILEMYAPHEIFEFNLVYCDKIVEKVMNKIYELNT